MLVDVPKHRVTRCLVFDLLKCDLRTALTKILGSTIPEVLMPVFPVPPSNKQCMPIVSFDSDCAETRYGQGKGLPLQTVAQYARQVFVRVRSDGNVKKLAESLIIGSTLSRLHGPNHASCCALEWTEDAGCDHGLRP